MLLQFFEGGMKSTKREMVDKICECSAKVGISEQQVKKKKRNRPSEFEYWEDESYFPGVPVLPVSGFPYKRTDTTTKKLKQNMTRMSKTTDLTSDSPVKSRPSVQVNPDSDSDEMLSKPVFIPRDNHW
ncbi:hypothetical protein OS493_000367 [Desmophyllum pertusum]|uniref:Uncharacterized protein n=1 Tax=Desmophyllum pertusum TaxID=174260 RepID=A0A9X0A733_9CNID|nr:hypothetical protein OS493_000367 [Desmophyllum pertusum]